MAAYTARGWLALSLPWHFTKTPTPHSSLLVAQFGWSRRLVVEFGIFCAPLGLPAHLFVPGRHMGRCLLRASSHPGPDYVVFRASESCFRGPCCASLHRLAPSILEFLT